MSALVPYTNETKPFCNATHRIKLVLNHQQLRLNVGVVHCDIPAHVWVLVRSAHVGHAALVEVAVKLGAHIGAKEQADGYMNAQVPLIVQLGSVGQVPATLWCGLDNGVGEALRHKVGVDEGANAASGGAGQQHALGCVQASGGAEVVQDDVQHNVARGVQLAHAGVLGGRVARPSVATAVGNVDPVEAGKWVVRVAAQHGGGVVALAVARCPVRGGAQWSLGSHEAVDHLHAQATALQPNQPVIAAGIQSWRRAGVQ